MVKNIVIRASYLFFRLNIRWSFPKLDSIFASWSSGCIFID